MDLPENSAPGAGWAWDPSQRHDYRWWQDESWTDRVLDGVGPESVDPKRPKGRVKVVLSGPPARPLARYKTTANSRGLAFCDIGDGFVVIGVHPNIYRISLLSRVKDRQPWFLFRSDQTRVTDKGRLVILTDQLNRVRMEGQPGMVDSLVAAGFRKAATSGVDGPTPETHRT